MSASCAEAKYLIYTDLIFPRLYAGDFLFSGMQFEEWLRSKKIDPEAFRKGSSVQWEEFRRDFDAMSPVAFDLQKKFFINPIRRLYPLKVEVDVEATVVTKKVRRKPVMRKPVVREGNEEKESGSVPKKRPKPVMKSQDTSESKEDVSEPKNKVSKKRPRPVMKRSADESEQEKKEGKEPVSKKKRPRPVMKKSSEEKPSEEQISEVDKPPVPKKKRPRPVMKKPEQEE